jgi:hypothetical protein
MDWDEIIYSMTADPAHRDDAEQMKAWMQKKMAAERFDHLRRAEQLSEVCSKLNKQLADNRKVLDTLMEAIRDDLRAMKNACGPDCKCEVIPSEDCMQNKLPRTMRALVVVALGGVG